MNVIEIRPSRRLALLLAGGHALAAFSCTFLPEPWYVCIGLGLVALSLVRGLRAARGGPPVIAVGEDGGLRLAPYAAVDEEPSTIMPATVASSGAIWLVWREARGRRTGALLLFQDQMAPAAWRELQGCLRLRAGHPAAIASGDT